MNNKQYYAYIRVSTVKQGEGVSLEAQREAIERYADQHGLSVVKWYEARETAAKHGRPLFTAMIKQLKAGKADGVIMHKIDRSARNLRDWATVGELQDSGIDVHFAAESVDFASRGGRLTADIQAVIAADYIRNLREETIKGINGRLKQGLYPFKAPIGYLDTGKGNPKTICPQKGPHVRHLFECYARGEHSLWSLVAEAERIGLKSFRGGKVTKTCIEWMLVNPFYIGLIHIKSRSETFQGIHEPLISATLFQQVQRARENKSVKKITKHSHTYRRVFQCGRCETAYIPERQKGHVYYRCHTKSCTRGTVREESIQQAVGARLLGMQISSYRITQLHRHMRQWADRILKTETNTTIPMQLGKIKRKQDQLLDAYLDGLIDKNIFEERKAQFLVQETELSQQARKQPDSAWLQAETTQFLELFKNLYLTYSLANSSEKRQILEILFSNRSITDRNVELTTKNWIEKATNGVGFLCGAHYHATSRKGQEFPTSVTDDLNTLFNCPEWKQITQLHKNIHNRKSDAELPKPPTTDDYHVGI